MKIAVIIVRVLMGIIFTLASIVVLFDLVPQPELEGDVRVFNLGLEAAVYFVPLLKVIELLCGIAFITGRFVPLATVMIFPVILNITLYHLFLAPEGLALAIFLLLGNLFLAFYYRKNYQGLVAVK